MTQNSDDRIEASKIDLFSLKPGNNTQLINIANRNKHVTN